MAGEGIHAWAAHAPLWDSGDVARQARAWLRGEGTALLDLRSSQIGLLRDTLSQARTNEALRTAIESLGGNAASHQKSPWNRKGDKESLRTRLWNGVESALNATRTHMSAERTAFESLCKLIANKEALEAIRDARDLRIRKQFLQFVMDGYQAREWLKEDAV